MPMWCPPTPPQDEKDVYIDHALGFLYESTVMSEAQLPPVYVRREHKRQRLDVVQTLGRDNRRAIKSHFKDYHKDEASVIAAAHAPRSLFDRPTPAVLKYRRDLKLHKYRGLMRTGVGIVATPALPPSLQQLHGLRTSLITNKPTTAEIEGQPEWLIHEDYALLQTIQNLQELPLNLMVLSPGHTPNWDLIADMVNNVSRTYRSPKFCKHRYDNVIVPREEGKLVYDPSAKPRQKKNKLVDGSGAGSLHGYPSKQQGAAALPPSAKTTRGLRTSQLYIQDNNLSYSLLYMQRFDVIKTVSNKRVPTVKPLLVNPNLKNPKHAAVLSDHGINYELPLNPIEVATRRAERILQEKNKNTQEIALAQNKQSTTSTTAATTPTPSSSATTSTSLVGSSMVSGSNIKAATSGVGVTTVAPAPVILPVAISSNKLSTPVRTATPPVSSSPTMQVAAAIAAMASSKTSASGAGSVGSGPQTMVVASPVVSVSQAGRTTRPVATLTVQDMVRGNPTVVSVAGLSSAQVQVAANRLTTATLAQSQAGVSTVVSKVGGTVTTKQLNPAQMQYYRQQALLRHSLRNQQIKQLQVQSGQVTGSPTVNPGQKVTGTPAGTLAVTAVQVSTASGQPRTQYIKQTAGGKQITRTVSESEMSAILKRQIAAQKAAVAAAAAAAGGSSAVNSGAGNTGTATVTQVQVPTQAGMSSAQLLAQAGLQVRVQPAGQGQGQVATLVKAVGSSSGQPPSLTIPVSGMTIPHQGFKATLTNAVSGTVKTTPQQFRQLAIQQQLLQRKMAAAAAAAGGSNAVSVASANVTTTGGITKTATGKPTQLIVQTTNKALPSSVTVQQIQQVIKHVQPQHMQHIIMNYLNADESRNLALLSSEKDGVVSAIAKNPNIYHHVTTGGQVTAMNSSSAPGVVLAKATGQPGGAGTTTRVIPVSVATQGQGGQQLKQTIQVVATSGRTDASGRTPTAIKVASSVSSSQQQAILSQVSAALQGQPITFRQRAPGSSTPLMAVTVQQAPVQHSAAVLAAAAAAAGQQQQQQQQQQNSGTASSSDTKTSNK